MVKNKLEPPAYLLISILLMLVLRFTNPGPEVIVSPWNLLGLILVGFGIWINLSADRAFKRARTTVNPYSKPSTLISTGAFRVTRNPMYLGFVAILLGVFVLLQTLYPIFIAIIFGFVIDRVFIQIEEKNMEQVFSGDWQMYKERVRRWL